MSEDKVIEIGLVEMEGQDGPMVSLQTGAVWIFLDPAEAQELVDDLKAVIAKALEEMPEESIC